MKSVRTFVAVELPQDITEYLRRLSDGYAKLMPPRAVRWVTAANMHLTLRFLGATQIDLIGDLKHSLDQIALRHREFEMNLTQLGCFPNKRRPRVIWVGLTSQKNELPELQDEIEANVIDLGWPADTKSFHPHLTLGRVKNQGAVIEAELPWGEPVANMKIFVSGIHLIESQLKPSGAEYTVLHTSPLQAN